MAYNDDKRELLKLKQGIIEESDTIHEEEKPVYELHGMKKVENFFYHYKWHVIVGAFFLAVAIFLTVSVLTKKQGDMRVLVITKNAEIANNVMNKTQQFEEAFELYCPDYDNSGYIHVDTYNIDLSDNPNSEYAIANVTKATSEILYGEGMLFIVDMAGAEAITEGDFSDLVDLSELYPECEYIDRQFLHIKGTAFASNANYIEACPDDLYMVVRAVNEFTPNRERSEIAQKKALEVIGNIVNGNFAGWKDDQGRIYGIKN